MSQSSSPTQPDDVADLLPARLSRRDFGKLLGMPTLLGSAAALTGCVSAGEPLQQPVAAPHAHAAGALTRGAFVAMIADYFNWVHSSEYIDPYKAVQPTFVDVSLGTTAYARQIETALEESLISNAQGYFYPDRPMTREDAADIYLRAFSIPLSAADALGAFTDADTIAADKKPSVNALVAAGYMKGLSATSFAPTQSISGRDAHAILSAITSHLVAPPQVMCKSGTAAPRRYVRISTPTEGAELYYAVTFDGSEPADPSGPAGLRYEFSVDGVLQFVNPLSSITDARLYRLKAGARKSGMASSAVREYVWYIVRPRAGAFEAKLVHAGTRTTPTVWKIHNPAEYFQANVYYLEGSTRGLVFDSGEYSYQKANIKTLIDSLATKPYDIVLGHNHPDHAEQIYNFTSAGITLYVSAIERAALIASNRKDFQSAGNAAAVLHDGQQLDLGNVQVTAWQIPGHTNGLTTLIVNQTGWVYGSDMWGCNRAYTADTTQYQGVKVDLFLSLVLQIIANYRSSSGRITEVTNAHQEVSVGSVCLDNFVKCFQQLIDEGNGVARPSIRGGTKGGDRMSMVGDMWRDRNWMAIGPIGKCAEPVDYLTRPTTEYPCHASIDYNTADGYRKYSVLSNLEVSGGTLVGVEVYWNTPANGVANRQSNKFDPWTYEYAIKVPASTRSIAIKPTAMSNRIASMKVNDAAVAQASTTTVAVSAGSRIIVDVLSPDGSTRSTYTLKVAVA
jgi:glyoxylase-like metal-dependent hydrolase (beta-lactamase superfamily II)